MAIQDIATGEKLKAAHGVKLRVAEETVTKFADFCLRPDNMQDVAYGSRVFPIDDGASFINLSVQIGFV